MLGQGEGTPLVAGAGGNDSCWCPEVKPSGRVEGKALPVSRVFRGAKSPEAGCRGATPLPHTLLAMYKCALRAVTPHDFPGHAKIHPHFFVYRFPATGSIGHAPNHNGGFPMRSEKYPCCGRVATNGGSINTDGCFSVFVGALPLPFSRFVRIGTMHL